MKKITVMVSSTVRDMGQDRKAVVDFIEAHPLLEYVPLVGGAARATNSHNATTGFATRCDLFILIAGESYGDTSDTLQTELSPTELEFNAAKQADPTKIIFILRKSDVPVDPRQADFVRRNTAYSTGYHRGSYQLGDLTTLVGVVQESIEIWMHTQIKKQGINTLGRFYLEVCQVCDSLCVGYEAHIFDDRARFNFSKAGKFVSISDYTEAQISADFFKCLSEIKVGINAGLATFIDQKLPTKQQRPKLIPENRMQGDLFAFSANKNLNQKAPLPPEDAQAIKSVIRTYASRGEVPIEEYEMEQLAYDFYNSEMHDEPQSFGKSARDWFRLISYERVHQAIKALRRK
jgi:Domain of unknown function (DUF4062)